MADEIFEFDSRLDTEYLQSIYEDDKESAAMIFEQFLSSYPQQINDIENALAGEDVELYRSQIHKIKATFSFVGLTTLTTEAEMIEKNCRSTNNLADIRPLHEDFKKRLDFFIPILQAELVRLEA
jgi:HPt (histidine-containing phosphotransfer) domain-containing protein